MKSYFLQLVDRHQLKISEAESFSVEDFLESDYCVEKIKEIKKLESELMEKWVIRKELLDFQGYNLKLPNGTEGKLYDVNFEFDPIKFENIVVESFEGIDEIGLHFNEEDLSINGIPAKSGDFTVVVNFYHLKDSDKVSYTKEIFFFINPDPKKLWKNLPSDQNDMFWKEDDVTILDRISESQSIIVSSKRGRSHQNVGSFRDDDFAYLSIPESGWSIVSVSDGAGSYKFSRKGSELACKSIVDFFSEYFQSDEFLFFDQQLNELGFENIKDTESLSKKILYKGVLNTFNEIKSFAESHYNNFPEEFEGLNDKSPIEFFHCTLVFTVFKRFKYGTVFLTFSVGDCPAAVYEESSDKLNLLNWLDIGEFGGGTRFITQANIFHSKEHPMASRFSMKVVENFSHVFLMTDGIYDPKFIVESNLEKPEYWSSFLSDLRGNNENQASVSFKLEDENMKNEFSTWMDFWSPGNHDDRTLAIIF